MNKFPLLALVSISAILNFTAVNAAELKIAVASNFKDTFRVIAQRFEESSGHSLLISPGSTGKHFAQISNGAPYDLFLAADIKRPSLVENQGLGIKGTRETYAIGKLALLSNLDLQSTSPENLNQIFDHNSFRHLAIANPNHAPYGKAAMDVLRSLNAWPKLESKLVQGENIAQTLQFVASGNAEVGFVAYSQVLRLDEQDSRSAIVIPATLYKPIEQQLILLRESLAGRELLAFLRSDTVLEIVREYGYDTPDAK